MRKFKVRWLSSFLSVMLLTAGSYSNKAHAVEWEYMMLNAVGTVIVGAVPKVLENVWSYVSSLYEGYTFAAKIKKYGGFKS